MLKHSNRLIIGVLALGWFFDFLFWGQPTGVNVAIFLTTVLLTGFALLIGADKRPAAKSLGLLIPYAFFVVMTFVRQEPLTLFLAFTFALFSVGVLAVTYLGGRWTQYSLLDYFYKLFKLLGGAISLPIELIVQIRKEQPEQGMAARKIPLLPILRGLLLALPVVACFASLLASADLIFNQLLVDLFKDFDVGKIPEYVTRLIIMLCWAYAIAGSMLHAASESSDEKLLGENEPVIKPFLGFTESAIILGSVTLLFLAFVIVQFRYFFGGNLNIGVEGFTYSQYARRGFNELVAVAFFSLVMILGLSTISKRDNPVKKRIFSGLSIAIVALVMVILVSAYQRLILAIDWHGFSRLRLYPQIFLVWVGLLFVAVVILEVFHQERYFAFAAVLASIGFAVSLSLFNVDAAIARHNILRATQGKHFNPAYLATLSPDAVPALAADFSNPALSSTIREGIGAALLCQQHSKALADTNQGDWRSFNLSRWQAQQALKNIKTQLADYHYNSERKPPRVRTPGNVLYLCTDSEMETRE